MMSGERVGGVTDTGLFDYDPLDTRLLLRIWQALADGRPVSAEHSARIISELGNDTASANRFLDTVCERDPAGDIIGAVGLALDGHPYRFRVNGVDLCTWCAVDTLFLPAMLGRRAEVRSVSPLSGDNIRLIVDAQGVQCREPESTVVSLPVVDAADVDTGSARGGSGHLLLPRTLFCHPRRRRALGRGTSGRGNRHPRRRLSAHHAALVEDFEIRTRFE